MMKNWFDQGVSISEIVRQTGYNRKTIRKYVHSSSPPVYRKRARKASKLDEYRDYIIGRLQEHPLSAKRIYDETKANLEYKKTSWESFYLSQFFNKSLQLSIIYPIRDLLI